MAGVWESGDRYIVALGPNDQHLVLDTTEGHRTQANVIATCPSFALADMVRRALKALHGPKPTGDVAADVAAYHAHRSAEP